MTEYLQVSELFYSIQGESTWQGFPCLFIRLANCNLRCDYCDARYTWTEPGASMSLDDILTWLHQYPETKLVEITGGEPLLQPAAYPLMHALLDQGYRVLLETNGSFDLSQVPDTVHIIMDVKCPGSGMDKWNREENLAVLVSRYHRGCRDEIKFVLTSETDFHWAKTWLQQGVAQKIPQGIPPDMPVFFSPAQPFFAPHKLAALLLAHHLSVRLQTQLHTLLWPEKTRAA